MSRILFLNRVFGPDTEATGVLLHELAEDLAFEHEVTVICARTDSSRFRIGRLFQRESHGAMKVVRTFALSISKSHGVLRYLDLFIYFGLAWIAAFREHPDIIIAETDPPALGLLGAIFGRLRSCRSIYYCQDVYPDVAVATGGLKNRALLGLLRRCNRFAYRRSDAIVALAADMAGLLRLKGIPADKIAIIPNWIDCNKVKPQALRADWREKYSANFVVMYAGNLGWTQKLESLLEAAHLLRGEPRVKFILVGDGARRKQLQDETRLRSLTNVEFIDRVNPNAISEVLAAADLHLIPLGAGVAGCMVPSKVYGILAAGKPFVAMMEKHAEVARLALEFEVGFVVPPGDAVALARTIAESMANRYLLAEMGVRARALAEQTCDRRLATKRFADFLEVVLSGGRVAAIINEIGVAPNLEIEKVSTMPAK